MVQDALVFVEKNIYLTAVLMEEMVAMVEVYILEVRRDLIP